MFNLVSIHDADNTLNGYDRKTEDMSDYSMLENIMQYAYQ